MLMEQWMARERAREIVSRSPAARVPAMVVVEGESYEVPMIGGRVVNNTGRQIPPGTPVWKYAGTVDETGRV